jgi:WD40-like Beta Propeller Repeat
MTSPFSSRCHLAGRAASVLATAAVAGVAALGLGASSAGAAGCPNEAIREEQQRALAAPALPECRALEMVSPVAKEQANAEGVAIADSGDRLEFGSAGALAGAPGRAFNNYVAQRGATGWLTHSINLPGTPARKSEVFASPLVPPDLSRGVSIGLSDQEFLAGIAAFYSVPLDGAAERIGDIDPVSPESRFLLRIPGASADLSHLIFTGGQFSRWQLVPGGAVPGFSAEGTTNIYEAIDSGSGPLTYRMVNVDTDGSSLGCGATFGGLGTTPNTNSTGQHAISEDGSTIFFVGGEEPHPGGGACDGFPPQRVFARVDGTHTLHVSESECTRVAPACDTTNGNDVYEGASADGTRVFFVSTRQLADSDTDLGGKDLYLYDASLPAGERLIQASRGDGQAGATDGAGAGVQGVVGIADDGSRAYFVATGVLTTTPNARGDVAASGADNMYVFEHDAAHPAGRIAFIATLDPRDGKLWEREFFDGIHNAYEAPRYGAGGPETGGDGHIFAFSTYAQLTTSDTDDAQDVYRYDDQDQTLVRVSVATAGAASGTGNGPLGSELPVANHQLANANATQMSRSVTEDGDTVLFVTSEGLSPEDTNGVPDLYSWHDGVVSWLSTGTTEIGIGEHVQMTPSGSNVAFETKDHLLPQDVDTGGDLYDVRVDGGFPQPPPPPPPCAGEPCQGSLTPVPFVAAPASTTAASLSPLPPSFSVRPLSSKQRRALARTGSVTLAVTAAAAGTVSAAASAKLGKRSATIASASEHLARAGTAQLALTLSPQAQARLASSGKMTVKIAVTYSKSPTVRHVTLKLTHSKSGSGKSGTGAGANSNKGGRS